jgi:hypothetical protein
MPGPCCVNGLHQITNSSLEVHTVAAQAIVHQEFPMVVLRIEENFRVSGAMQARRPIGVLILVATPAPLAHS